MGQDHGGPLEGHVQLYPGSGTHMKERGVEKTSTVTALSVLRASTLGVAGYAAAKELARFRITVNCVARAVYTRMTDRLMEVDQSTLEQRATRVPLGWFGQPDDVAPTFVFFACKDADYITGQVLAVDGGSTL